MFSASSRGMIEMSFEEERIVPLRDHFRPPVSDYLSWPSFYGGWPMVIVQHLIKVLPEPYVAAPNVYPGTRHEIDIGTFREWSDSDATIESPVEESNVGGAAVAIAKYAPPTPTVTLEPQFANQDNFEIHIYDVRGKRQLVAVIELVSPSNKDRPENRTSFVAKMANLLQIGICATLVDVVSTRQSNLYAELMDFLDGTDPGLGQEPPSLYAVTLRTRLEKTGEKPLDRSKILDAWYHPLELGQKLPTLPVWLNASLAVPLELEASYEETCRTLRIK